MYKMLVLCAAIAGCFQARGETGLDFNERGVKAAHSGNYAQAEALYRRAIEQWRAEGQAGESSLAATLINLGQSLAAQGRRAEALDVYQEAVEVSRRALGDVHINTLSAMNHLATTYAGMGQERQAEPLFKEAASLLRKHYPGDLQLGRSLAGLAAVRIWNGEIDAARPLAEEALQIALSTEGELSAEAALMYSTIAQTHLSGNRPERAYPLYRKSIYIYEQVLGPGHPRVAATRSQAALALLSEGKLSMAEDELRKALISLESSCPRCETELCDAQTNYAAVRVLQGKYDQADKLLRQVLSIQEKGAWPGSSVAATLRALAVVRQKERKFDEAASLNRRADALTSYR